MAEWVNFAEVRSRVSLEDVLVHYYGLTNLRRDGKKLVGPCPVHGGDSPRAFHADLDRNVWHCFSRCRRGGNQLDLVAAKESIPIRDAALRLQAFFANGRGAQSAPPPADRPAPPPAGPPSSPAAAPAGPADSHEPEEEPATSNPPIDVRLDLKGDHPHLLEQRHLSPETIRHFGVGYCSRGILRGTIAIPIHDEDGDLVAYAGRRLKAADVREHGKYRLPKGFRKELVLYNLHRAKAGAKEHGLVLVEGFFSVLALHQAGLTNAVASMGCSLSEPQAALLADYASQVVILYDGDEAGWSGAEAAQRLLSPRLPARLARLPAGLEPEDLEPKALRWLVNGARELDLLELSFAFL